MICVVHELDYKCPFIALFVLRDHRKCRRSSVFLQYPDGHYRSSKSVKIAHAVGCSTGRSYKVYTFLRNSECSFVICILVQYSLSKCSLHIFRVKALSRCAI